MRFRFRPSPAMIVACIALFVALGGTATAVTYVVSSNSQIGPGTVSGHKPPTGKHANIIAGSVNGQDVANNSLTGADIADRSGVETCKAPLVLKFGPICAGSDGVARTWSAAISQCGGLGLRLPSPAEAVTLAKNYDVPGVSGSQLFWTDNEFYGSSYRAVVVDESSVLGDDPETNSHQTVCVTDPST
jgi:hypothetical protein